MMTFFQQTQKYKRTFYDVVFLLQTHCTILENIFTVLLCLNKQSFKMYNRNIFPFGQIILQNFFIWKKIISHLIVLIKFSKHLTLSVHIHTHIHTHKATQQQHQQQEQNFDRLIKYHHTHERLIISFAASCDEKS